MRVRRVLSLFIVTMLLMGNVYAYDEIPDFATTFKFNLFGDHIILFEKEAIYMNGLGLFDGVDPDKYVPALEKNTSREQAFKILAKALDWEVDLSKKSAFTDVSTWAQPFVAEAVKRGITDGIGNGKFGGQDPITFKQLNAILLRSIGYDSKIAWSDTGLYATKEFGFNYPHNYQNDSINRDKLIGTIFVALSNGEQKGQSYTLLEGLAYKYPAMESYALKSKLISPNYREDKNMDRASIATRLKMESFDPYFDVKADALGFVKESLESIGLKPLYFEITTTNNFEKVYEYPDQIDGIKSLKIVTRFGYIALDKGDTGLYIRVLNVDESDYMTLYGLDVGDVFTNDYFDSNDMTETDSWMSNDHITNIFTHSTMKANIAVVNNLVYNSNQTAIKYVTVIEMSK